MCFCLRTPYRLRTVSSFTQNPGRRAWKPPKTLLEYGRQSQKQGHVAIPRWEDACRAVSLLGSAHVCEWPEGPVGIDLGVKNNFSCVHRFTNAESAQIQGGLSMNSRNKLEDDPHPISDSYLKSIESDSNPGSLGFICFENVIQIKCSLCTYAWKAWVTIPWRVCDSVLDKLSGPRSERRGGLLLSGSPSKCLWGRPCSHGSMTYSRDARSTHTISAVPSKFQVTPWRLGGAVPIFTRAPSSEHGAMVEGLLPSSPYGGLCGWAAVSVPQAPTWTH